MTQPPVDYMERTRLWYEAQGYESPYVWAHHEDAPFTPLSRPLAESTVGLVITASPIAPDGGPVLPKRVHSLATSDPPERLFTNDLSWDKQATHTDDLDSYAPAHRLAELAAQGTIAAIAPRLHGIPTEYSQRRTRETDAPEVLRRLREDGADVALLVPL